MLYVDGGSNTYGDEITDREKNAWPYLLGDYLDCDVINQATKGKSNQHIVFDLLNICSQCKPDLVIIGWVNVSRKMFVRRENNFLIDISPSGQNSVYADSAEFNKFQHLLYKYWSNYLYDAWQFLHHVILTQKFLDSQNIPYLMFNDSSQSDILDLLTISSKQSTIKDKLLDAFHQMNDSEIDRTQNQLQALYQTINHQNFYDFSWNIKKIVKFDSHPSINDHQIISKFILSLLENRQ